MPDPSPSPHKNTSFWLILLILCLLVAQFFFSQPRANGQPPWLAIGAIAVGIGALVASQGEYRWLRWLETRLTQWLQTRPTGANNTAQSGRDWAVVLSVLFILYTLWQIPLKSSQENYTLPTLAWAASVLLFLLAVAPEPLVWPNWRRLWLENRGVILVALGLTLGALLLRVWQIGTIPATLAGDEASQGLEALHVIQRVLRNPFGTGWLGVPTMSFFFNSLTIRWLGATVVALRLPWVLIGTGTVLLAFLLGRQLKGTAWGLFAAAFVALYHYHIHYSRLGSNQIADPFFLTASLWLLYRGLDKQSRLSFALSGVVCGLAFYFYAGARLTPVVILVILGYLFLREPRHFWRTHNVNLFIMLTAFLITFAPMGQYAIYFPGDFNARLNMVGIIQNGWLAQQAEISGSVWPALWDQFQRAFLAFNFYPDRTVWYGLQQPLLDPFFGMLFLLGLGYATVRLIGKKADTRMAPIVAWWWGGMILGGMLTESPPSSQRLVTLTVPTCFFIAQALWEIVQLGEASYGHRWKQVLLVIAVFMFGLTSLNTYFNVYTPQRLYGGPHALLATEIVPRLEDLQDEHRFYFLGPPWMYWTFATIPYLLPEAEGADINNPIAAATLTEMVGTDNGAVFVILPERQSELSILQSVYPTGELETFNSPVADRLMVSLYIVAEEDLTP